MPDRHHGTRILSRANGYAISDLVDDLRDPRSFIEAAAIIGALHEQLGDFYFRAQGLWSASKKQLPRRLAKINPTLFVRWEEAFLQAWRGQTKQVIELTEDILRPLRRPAV
jgi:hypothetical protein